MAWQGVEIEIQVPCAEGQKHPVRLRFTGWGEYEVAYNPCEELLGPVFARMAACTHYLHEQFPEAFRKDTSLKRRLVEALRAAGAPAVPALLQALGDLDEDVRRAAAEALGKLGNPQAVPALLQALGDLDEDVRRAAAEALGAIGNPQAVPALIQALGDLDEDVCCAAAEALVKIGTPAVPALIQALEDDWYEVRCAAAEALGKLGDAQAVPALSVWVHAGANAARHALQALGHPALDLSHAVAQVAAQGAWGVLIRALPNEKVRKAVVGLGAPAVPALIQALGDRNEDVRCAAAEALGKLGDAQAVPALSVWVHAGANAACHALQALGHPALDLSHAVAQVAAQGAWGVLIRALPNEKVRKAVVGLGAPAVPALIQALGDRNEDVRCAAAEALGAIGNPQAVPALLQALGDLDEDVRRAACEALGAIGDPQAVPALIQALGDYLYNVRRAACEALGAIGDPQAVPALIQALGDDWYEVRRAAAEALVKIGTPAVPALIQALGDWDSDVRRAAAAALGAIGDPQAVPALIEALGDWNEHVRRAAAEALGAIGDPQAVPQLIKALKDDWSIVREEAAEALGKLGDPQAVPALTERLQDESGDVRKAAQDAIQRIQAKQSGKG